MSTTLEAMSIDTIADLLDRAGGVPPERVLFRPFPATETDLLSEVEGKKRLCELVDGFLVEKTMGHYEARVAMVLGRILDTYAEERNLGIVYGPDATIRLIPGLVRLPDVSFYSWRHFPNRELPPVKLLPLTPDLAVEVLSEGNTPAEMERKLREYFGAGCHLVWYIDPDTRTARVYTEVEECTSLTGGDALDGMEVVPGFRLALSELFARAGKLAR